MLEDFRANVLKLLKQQLKPTKLGFKTGLSQIECQLTQFPQHLRSLDLGKMCLKQVFYMYLKPLLLALNSLSKQSNTYRLLTETF